MIMKKKTIIHFHYCYTLMAMDISIHGFNSHWTFDVVTDRIDKYQLNLYTLPIPSLLLNGLC